MRLRLDLAYDGGDFYGWAKQPTLRTVQGVLEDALHKVLRVNKDDASEPLRLSVAGRTDTGVHASYQVCHLDVSESVLQNCVGHTNLTPVKALEYRLCGVLPKDISIHSVSVAPSGFDARFSALDRTYVYRISDAANRANLDPRMRGFVLQLDYDLNVDAMNQAASLIVGLHDFGSFARPNPGGTTIRCVKKAVWNRVCVGSCLSKSTGKIPCIENGLIEFTIVADAFAHNMVRSLVGACVQVGRAKRSVDWFKNKIENPIREGSTGLIAANGLTLEYVEYPKDEELGARANAIRAKRTIEELG
ncbi:tRNA pseudouridine(38-40) synthase TruA [Bifidobacterium sp. UMB6791A]|nr:tRNA pseudouridine(38-40) synthase TruA [Bifidobacterium sp. UMB6791B]MDK8248679.1 tRNA pseudouridine(38-40) synthase TruA [Bifidobacterium sp. UMB6794B]MDK8635808.1 tRNA pseudouridine(38-40) synthase TruA [Bifidobacterium sp. UMB6791A]